MAEVKAYVDSYTPLTIQAFSEQAGGVLVEFAQGAVADAKPQIVEQALKGSLWRTIWQSIIANGTYTLLLIAVVVILRWAGVDLLSLAT